MAEAKKKAYEYSNNITAAMGFQSSDAFLRRTWVISGDGAPIRDSALRGHFMPSIASDIGTLSTTPGNYPESFSDRKTTERRARFNLRTLWSRARHVSLLLPHSQRLVRRHVSIIVGTTTTTSFLINQIHLETTKLIWAESNA